MYQQSVVRFCQGAADKEAGNYASNIRPKNIEEVTYHGFVPPIGHNIR
jgi:hypothetical protein